MSDIVIKAENLGKKYIIGHKTNERYFALRDVMVQTAQGMWKKTKDLLKGRPVIIGDEYEEIWALKNVNFEVKQGEVIGIIGRNGAGKSTLLKILSRITEPTTGRVTIKGRVASLLEVGTGFHPELTGRENIYLNGAILGMSRAEIKKKFDEIVAFAEIEKYLDTPVKRYSSGMYVRLAFAVAAHLEPEILLVDEVLAVGDAAFQKKCLGKMGDVAKEGRTVLFVSHNMGAIEHLCARTMLLDEGHLIRDGATKNTIASYTQLGFVLRKRDLSDFSKRKGSGEVRIINISLRDRDNRPINAARCGESIKIILKFAKLHLGFNRNIYVSVLCKTMLGTPVFLQHNRMAGVDFTNLPERGEFICEIDTLNLAPSTYLLTATILAGSDYIDAIEDAFELTVEAGDCLGHGEVPPLSFGPLLMKAKWSIRNEVKKI